MVKPFPLRFEMWHCINYGPNKEYIEYVNDEELETVSNWIDQMTKPFPLRFELPSPVKCLRVERQEVTSMTLEDNIPAAKTGQGYWRLWLMANGDFTLGTFIQLLDNGTINRVTYHEDGTESVMQIVQDD